MKKVRLNFRPVSEEDLGAMASETLLDGGYVEPSPEPPREMKVGDKMPDGTIFAGISPNTGQAMFATPEDAPLTMTWKKAMKYAQDLNAHGHQDWRAPTIGELKVLFNNRAAIGGFNVTGSHPAGWYWSASENHGWHAWDQRFSDGYQFFYSKGLHSSVRCVR